MTLSIKEKKYIHKSQECPMYLTNDTFHRNDVICKMIKIENKKIRIERINRAFEYEWMMLVFIFKVSILFEH